MTQSIPATIRLSNKNYTIKCPEAEVEHLQQAAAKLNQLLLLKKNQFKRLDDHSVLLLAALEISHELVVNQIKHQEQNQQLAQLISLLESKVNHAG